MSSQEIQILIKLLLGAIASFWAIFFWSKERDNAWTFMVLGVLCYYVNTLLSALDSFKIIDIRFIQLLGLPAIPILLESLPILLFSIGFVMGIIKRSRLS
ncbi:MAG: hypothetical protein JXR70_18165 [Spirochaetales bacterium]|nr:hypothetical protein [Spirochaetales bacterium]